LIDNERLSELKSTAKKVRINIIKMLAEAGSGHPGGSLSIVEILTALYFQVMKVDPSNPNWPDRDRFVLSKGHAAPALYAVLAEKGFFSKEELMTLRKKGSILQGHPDMKKTPGVEISTGSLGQGLSVAVGMALGYKLDNKQNYVYVLLGDGEIEEGQIWEAAMAAVHYNLDNLIAVLDYNGLQIDGPISQVMSPEPIKVKWQAFGWNVIEIDGHDFEEIITAINEAQKVKGRPTILIAKTVKGKGVSFMENEVDWHGKAPSAQEAEQALRELNKGEE